MSNDLPTVRVLCRHNCALRVDVEDADEILLACRRFAVCEPMNAAASLDEGS